MQRIPAAKIFGVLAIVLLLVRPLPAAAESLPDVHWSGKLSKPSHHTPEWIAYTYMFTHKKRLGLRNPRKEMIVTGVTESDRRIQVQFQRYMYRTTVWGDVLTVELDGNGTIRSVKGTIHLELEKQLFRRPKRPAITSEHAVSAAKTWLNASHPSMEIGKVRGLCYLPDRPGAPLAYVIQAGRDSLVFVHAWTGKVIRSDI